MNYSETKPTKRNLITTDRILALFQTQLSFDKALSELLIHGYSKDDLVVKTQEEIAETRYFMSNSVEDSDKVILQKAIRGIKVGIILGCLTLGLVVLYLIWFNPHMLQAGPLSSMLFGLVVGAVWGGVMGFIIGPQLPFSPLKKYELTLSKGQIFLSFRPKSLMDDRFFKSLNWPIYTLTH